MGSATSQRRGAARADDALRRNAVLAALPAPEFTRLRGQLTITDRAGLEKDACGCYAIVRAEFNGLTGSL